MSFDFGFDDSLQAAGSSAVEGSTYQEPEPVSKTATVLDRWSLRIAEDHLRRNPITMSTSSRACETHSDDWVDYMFADCFNVMYSPDVKVAPDCVSPERHSFIKEVLANDEFASIRKSTVGHPTKSLASAYRIAEAYQEFLEEEALNDSSPPPAPGHWLDELDSEGTEGDGSKGDGPGDLTPEQQKSINNSLDSAAEAIDDDLSGIEDIERQFGDPGNGHQACSNDNEDMQTLAETFKRVRSSDLLRQISELSGRYISLARSYRKSRVPHGFEDMDGVTTGSHISRLTMTEMSRSRNVMARMDLMRRVVNSQALIKNVHGFDSLGKGPIAVILDESGSMTGRRIIHAKAIAMTFAWIARRQRRECVMYSYEGGGNSKTLKLPVGKWDHASLCQYLETFLCGGGYVDLPIRELPDEWESFGLPKGKTDVIMISDGYYNLDDIGTEAVNAFNEWRKNEQAHVTSICISPDRESVLGNVSDVTHCVSELSHEDGKIGEIFASA